MFNNKNKVNNKFNNIINSNIKSFLKNKNKSRNFNSNISNDLNSYTKSKITNYQIKTFDFDSPNKTINSKIDKKFIKISPQKIIQSLEKKIQNNNNIHINNKNKLSISKGIQKNNNKK